MLSHRLRRVLIAGLSSFSHSRSSNFTPVSSLLPKPIIKPPTKFPQSPTRLFSTTQYQYDPYSGEDKFTPDNEGCDFNHWLITMNFSQDNNNKPSREEMISIFEQTCAKGLGLSLEEAKKKIYAVCTTSYQGFQAVMSIGEVEQFRELPGVQYIIPDSYADVENKVYGGDKYENGVITPGPVPVPTREGFGSVEKESLVGQGEDQGSQAPSVDGSTSGTVQDRGSQTPLERGFKQGLGTLVPRQGLAQRSQMPSFQGNIMRDQGQGNFKQGQGTPPVGQGQAQGSQGQGAQTPPRQGLPSNYSQGALANYNQGPPRGNFVPRTQVNNNQIGQGNYSLQSGQGFEQRHGQGGPLLSPYQGSYNQGGQIPSYQMGYSQGLRPPVPTYQGNYNQGILSNYGQWTFTNYNQGPPHGNFLQVPQQNYNQGGQWNFGPQNGGYGSAQFGQMYPGQAQNQMPQYQLCYEQGQGAPFPGHWQCQGCGMLHYLRSYNQGQGTQNPGQWQGLGYAVPSYQASYSHSQGAFVLPPQGNYNHGIPNSYGQRTSANFNQGISVNYNHMRQGNYNPQSSGNYGQTHGAARNPEIQQEDQRNVAGDWSNNNNPADPTKTGKIPH